ncbi:MAG: serine/threonine-protein kinase [Polyangiaceae bacterium]
MASIPPPGSPLAVPGATIAGKYRLDALVGQGGMGAVWSATHIGLGNQVAIKLISHQHARSAEVRRRFDTEAKAVAKLKSRHVVQIYDNGELDDGTPYIAMELLQGESLHRRIHRAGPMQLPEAVSVLSAVCRALSRAHAAGIVHRDIKPDNIFLANSEEDGGYVTKVLDFGVAKLAQAEGEHSATQTGSLVGTPLYMSPEQARGLRTIDHRTDLYSLALVAYTMFTGNLAFSGDSFGDLLLKICTQDLPSLKDSAPWLPPSIDEWLRRASARDPKDRYQTAQEFADGLAIAAGMQPGPGAGLSVAGRPPAHSKPDRPDISFARPDLGESVTKQYSGSKPPTTGSNGGTMTGATLHADGEEMPLPKPSRAPIAIAAAVVGVLVLGGAAFFAFGHHESHPAAAAAGGLAESVTATTPPQATVAPLATVVQTPPQADTSPPQPTTGASQQKGGAHSSPSAPATTKKTGAPPTVPPPPAQQPAANTAKPVPSGNKPSKPNSGNVDLGY